MVEAPKVPVVFLSLPDLAEAVYDGRVGQDDLKKAKFCFVYDCKSDWDKGLRNLYFILRRRCILTEERLAVTYEILKEELDRAERKGRLLWSDETGGDPWGKLKRMLAKQGYKVSLNAERPFHLYAVIDEIRKSNLPLRAVSVPDHLPD
jgi:hypothetical protein